MRVVSVVAATAALGGCSFAVNRPPRTVTAEAPPRCTDSMALPGLDFVIAGATGLGGLAAGDDGGALLLGTGALFGLMGILGSSWVNDCRRKQAAFARLDGADAVTAAVRGNTQAGPPSATADAVSAPVAAGPTPASATATDGLELEPEPALEAEPAVADTGATASGRAIAASRCPQGQACPAGLKCDPLRHRCVAAAELGTENQRCARGSRCDAGLYCDFDRRVCLPGDLGLEGGACQTGDRCAAGLTCQFGVCVRQAGRRATSSGSIRAKTATRPTRARGPRRPERP